MDYQGDQREMVYKHNNKINDICELQKDGALFMISQNGELIWWKEGSQKTIHNFEQTECYAIKYDPDLDRVFVADQKNKRIIIHSMDNHDQDIYIDSFNDQDLIGPKCIQPALTKGIGYFTDTGSLSEAFMQQPKGSLYMFDMENLQVKPLCQNCLSYPSSIGLTRDEETLYLCETGKNRLLRFMKSDMGAFLYDVFVQFSGRFGPTAIDIDKSGLIFCARYEFKRISKDGYITIINSEAEILQNIIVGDAPEIISLKISQKTPNLLYVTDNDVLFRQRFYLRDTKKKKGDKGSDNSFLKQM